MKRSSTPGQEPPRRRRKHRQVQSASPQHNATGKSSSTKDSARKKLVALGHRVRAADDLPLSPPQDESPSKKRPSSSKKVARPSTEHGGDDVEREITTADEQLLGEAEQQAKELVGDEESAQELAERNLIQLDVEEGETANHQTDAEEEDSATHQTDAEEEETANHQTDTPAQSSFQTQNGARQSISPESDSHQLESASETPRNDLVQAVQTPRQGSGASADDAMDVDALTPRQTPRGKRHAGRGGTREASEKTPHEKPPSVVSTRWLLKKLGGLTADTLESGRAAILQDIKQMEEETAQLPRAIMPSSEEAAAAKDEEEGPATGLGSHHPIKKLQLIEKFAGKELSRIPKWRHYRERLMRMCRNPAVYSMDYRQRLAKIKEIIYLPEEMELLRQGDEARMACVIRLCAAVTELTGRDDEVIPEDMAAWVSVELKDMAWKAKITSVWHKYWPAAESMVID